MMLFGKKPFVISMTPVRLAPKCQSEDSGQVGQAYVIATLLRDGAIKVGR
jgi:hypothetical protein